MQCPTFPRSKLVIIYLGSSSPPRWSWNVIETHYIWRVSKEIPLPLPFPFTPALLCRLPLVQCTVVKNDNTCHVSFFSFVLSSNILTAQPSARAVTSVCPHSGLVVMVGVGWGTLGKPGPQTWGRCAVPTQSGANARHHGHRISPSARHFRHREASARLSNPGFSPPRFSSPSSNDLPHFIYFLKTFFHRRCKLGGGNQQYRGWGITDLSTDYIGVKRTSQAT